jgi:hypothetical protein
VHQVGCKISILRTRSSMCLFYWSVLKTGYTWECRTYVLKDHMNETENETVNFQTDLLIKTRESDAKFWNLVPSAIWPLVKQVSLKANAYSVSANWSESGASTVKMLSQGTNTLSGCIRVATYEGMKHQISHWIPYLCWNELFSYANKVNEKCIYWTKQRKAKPFIKCISYLLFYRFSCFLRLLCGYLMKVYNNKKINIWKLIGYSVIRLFLSIILTERQAKPVFLNIPCNMDSKQKLTNYAKPLSKLISNCGSHTHNSVYTVKLEYLHSSFKYKFMLGCIIWGLRVVSRGPDPSHYITASLQPVFIN